MDLGGFACDGADAEIFHVLVQHLLAVQVIEVDCGIFSGDLGEHHAATGVGVEEIGQVVDAVVDDAPHGVFGIALGNFLAGKCFGHHAGLE